MQTHVTSRVIWIKLNYTINQIKKCDWTIPPTQRAAAGISNIYNMSKIKLLAWLTFN